MTITDDVYDFIVVGGGPAGCMLATRLAHSLAELQILLIEAGGENADPSHQSYGDRHWTLATAPGYDWAYKTVPQEHLQGREINYNRGKGLGGSTAINFCVFTRGPRADYDAWADDVGDDSWSWKHAIERYKELETFGSVVHGYEGLVDASTSLHGANGPLQIGVPELWDEGFGEYLKTISTKKSLNLDHNSGDPLGMAVFQVSACDGRRITAANALLSDPPSNLSIITTSVVQRVILDETGRRAIGVAMSDKKIYARKEVILSAGAIDSPKILLLSGIGPRKELEKQNIPVLQNIPGIGKNLQDHLWLEIVTVQKPDRHHRTYITDPAALNDGRAEWMKDKSGPLADYFLPQMVAFLKSDKLLHSKEFQELDEATRKFLLADTIPHYELISHNPSFSIQAPEKYIAYAVALMSRQASGEVTLQTSDPSEAPKIDPKFLDHPFDRRVAIDSIRETLDVLNTPGLEEQRERVGSELIGRSDEEILEYVQATGVSMWHPCGTVKMGKPENPDTCVDKDCKVLGVQGLRVVDMSVTPLLPSAHTQAVAYFIGATAADKIITEHRTAQLSG